MKKTTTGLIIAGVTGGILLLCISIVKQMPNILFLLHTIMEGG